MKNFTRIIFLSFIILLMSGCVGTKTAKMMDWNNLHRVGPDTVARVYYWDDTSSTWVLSNEEYEIPEGHFIGPPPSVNNEK